MSLPGPARGCPQAPGRSWRGGRASQAQPRSHGAGRGRAVLEQRPRALRTVSSPTPARRSAAGHTCPGSLRGWGPVETQSGGRTLDRGPFQSVFRTTWIVSPAFPHSGVWTHLPPTWHTDAPSPLTGRAQDGCGFQRTRRVSSPGSQLRTRLLAQTTPSLSRAGIPPCPRSPWISRVGTRLRQKHNSVPCWGAPTLPFPPLQAEAGRGRCRGEPSDGRGGRAVVPVPGAGRALTGQGGREDQVRRRGAHSSLCRGRHWGQSFSSRTPSGAHTQGSWVSHCHLASWLRSWSSTWA